MKLFKPLVESGDLTHDQIESMYRIGALWTPREAVAGSKSAYSILEDGLIKRTGSGKPFPPGDYRTHHCLPLEHEVEFLKRGIDPNDGSVAGFFMHERLHDMVHDGKGAVAFNSSGGAWNYQWARFFEEFPGATADDIAYFRRNLYIRVFSLAKPNTVFDFPWKYLPAHLKRKSP